jgi:excisionase family DNA binding protein
VKTKIEAAEYLGMSVRTLLRHTAAGRIAASQRRGTRGAETVYDEGELEQFKKQLEGVTYPVRPVVTSGTNAFESDAALVPPNQAEFVGERFLAALESIAARDSKPSVGVVPIADKVILTLADAAVLTTLSRSHLLEAIHDGRLKAKIIGRGWRIKRNDLDIYVRKL